jgi:hypothetical protein
VVAFTGRRAGIVSTRLAGTDGVSLETAKWTAVLERLGVTSFYFAGELDRPAESSRLVPEAFYRHPEIDAITRTVLGGVFEGSEEAWDPDSANWADIRRLDFFSQVDRARRRSRSS